MQMWSLSGVQILNNKTIGTGGGVAMGAYCKVQIQEGTLINGNKASFYGGGIFGKGANVAMTGGEISDNQAQGSTYGCGGGLYLENGKLTASSGKILQECSRLWRRRIYFNGDPFWRCDHF